MKTETSERAEFVLSPGKQAAEESPGAAKPVAIITENTVKVWQVVLATFGVGLTIGAMVWTGVYSLRSDISAIRTDNALMAQRVAALEEKDRGYDRLVDLRNQQMMTIGADIAAIKASLAAIETGIAGRNGKP